VLTSLLPGFSETIVTTGFNEPTAMAEAPDGRIFVSEQGGNLRVVQNGTLLSQPFVSLNVDSTNERGLLGVALDPSFETNGYVYLYYTVPGAPAHNRVSRFTANGNVAFPGSELDILDLNNLSSATNHNGGGIHFGPDGKLYVAVGENANGANSQSLNTLLGKMLRINPDGSIPSDNPYVNQTTGINQAIWAIGLRNPFTFAFQPGTGRMFIDDVGENTWEEIDDGVAGSNYGWPATEGPTSNPVYRSPIFYYGHNIGSAITGGAFYDPTTGEFPTNYVGTYFFSDWSGNWIMSFDPSTGVASQFATGLPSGTVNEFVDPSGGLYYLSRGDLGRGSGSPDGVLARIDYSPPPPPPPPPPLYPPTITQQPLNLTVDTGSIVEFSVDAAGTFPLTYQWLRDGQPIRNATASVYYVAPAGPADNGAQFQVVVSNPYGQATSDAATLTVLYTTPPVPTITSPAPGTLYAGGESISFSGSATDANQGTLGASALTWEIDLLDGSMVRPVLGPVSGITSGTFVVPTTGDTSTHVFYQINLSATDSTGASQSTAVLIHPELTTFGLATNPAGLPLAFDGTGFATPRAIPAVVGLAHTIYAPATQILGGTIYHFTRWSDGSTANPRIVDVTPGSATLVADYKAAGIVPPVIVSAVQTVVSHGSISSLILTFSAALNPATAQKSAGYWVVLAGRDHRFGTRDDQTVRIRKAVYQPGRNTVTLTPGARLSAKTSIELVVSGSTSKPHPTDVWGRPIDGNKDGAPGGNFVEVL
jgi:glucose/arabinose dehydrogenase